jgi:hypothetical protein
MKRIITLALSVLLCTTSAIHAFDQQAIADTLTQIVLNHAHVAPVQISNLRVNKNNIKLYTNASLSHISLTPTELAEIRRLVSQMVLDHTNGKVEIYTNDVELDDLITGMHRSRPDSSRYVLPETVAWVQNQSIPYTTSKGLFGKHIALWGSHGRYYNQQRQAWLWQRATLWTTVEDLYTSSYTMPFLVPMLENAGAIVVQPRERDTQEIEQIIDDSQATVSNNAFVMVDGKGWATPTAPLFEGENPFTMGHYSVAESGIKGEIRYTPSLPAGEYAVYVSYKRVMNSTNQAKYTVVHKGQRTEFLVNQQMGGSTWVYLGTFAFDDDSENNYVSLASSGDKYEIVTADAVKFGGGMGSIARYPQPNAIENSPSSKDIDLQTAQIDSAELLINQQLAATSGMARYLEASRYWLQYAGVPDSVYNYTSSRNDYTDDYCSRGRWVNYLAGGSAANPTQPGLQVPLHLSLSFHTDAGTRYDSTIVGSLMIYTDFDNDRSKNYPTGVTRQLARDYGDYVQTQIVDDMRALFAPQWRRRHLQNSSYAESRYPLVPAILLELLSHQNFYDMQYGLDPRVRFVISRAIYKGMLRFLHAQYNTPYVVQPLPVQGMQMKRERNRISVDWLPTEDSLEPTAQPTYYIIYTRTNDGDWDNGTRIEDTHYSFRAEPGVRYDIRVQAGNDGGVSLPSEILSAYIAPKEKGNILILNAFTRVSGPEFYEGKTYAGIVSHSHGVGYGKDISFIGEQYDHTIQHQWINDDECGWGSCYCDQQATLTMGNTFDYPVAHGRVLAEQGYSYISANAYAIDTIVGYDAVDLIMGKQKTTILGTDTSFQCFTPKLQTILSAYLIANGRLLLSGAHAASDMKTDVEKKFIKKYLHCTYRCDHASKNGSVRVNNRQLEAGTYLFNISPNDERIHTENPECILPANGGVGVATYGDTNMNAAVAYNGTEEGKGKTLYWAFMLESSKDFDKLLGKSIEWLMKK